MAYGSAFPISYQQMYYPQQFQQGQSQQSNGIIWVQGEAGAKSYLVAPNTTVQLWDSENQVIYLKSADASGMPSMKILDYKIREAAQTIQPQVMSGENHSDYVTKAEFTALENKINAKFAEFLQNKEVKDGESTL